MTDIEITAEREEPTTCLLYSTAEEGTVTITLTGLTAIRIDPRTRTIAIDGISGEAHRDEPCLPDWFIITDLRDGTYRDFHRLKRADQCFDGRCAVSGQHNAGLRFPADA
jgi:hypothetical protein